MIERALSDIFKRVTDFLSMVRCDNGVQSPGGQLEGEYFKDILMDEIHDFLAVEDNRADVLSEHAMIVRDELQWLRLEIERSGSLYAGDKIEFIRHVDKALHSYVTQYTSDIVKDWEDVLLALKKSTERLNWFYDQYGGMGADLVAENANLIARVSKQD